MESYTRKIILWKDTAFMQNVPQEEDEGRKLETMGDSKMKYSINDLILHRSGIVCLIRTIVTRQIRDIGGVLYQDCETVYQGSFISQGQQFLDMKEEDILGYYKREQK